MGALVEHTWSDLRDRVLAAGAYLHPCDEFVVVLLPGLETEHGGASFLFRVGGSYEIPIPGGFTISPQVNVDFLEGGKQALVAGLGSGTKF